MVRKTGIFIALAAAGTVVACTDAFSPTDSAIRPVALKALESKQKCRANPDIVVSTNGELQQAADTAHPGSTIAIQGTILETGDVDVPTDDLTFTCATSGSGLAATPGAGINWLLVVRSRRVTVEGLVLDAGETVDGGAALAVNDPETSAVAEDFRFLDNEVSCGPGQCLFIVSANFGAGRGALVARNHFTARGSATGPQIQNFQDVMLEHNTVVAEEPSGMGILVNAGLNINVRSNEVRGPWATSLLYVDGVSGGTAENNRLTGASLYGVRLRGSKKVRIVNNEIRTVGSPAIFVSFSCFDRLAGNHFSSAPDTTVMFDVTTGANVFKGDPRKVVDNGNRDCDGDGIPDPNIIRERGREP